MASGSENRRIYIWINDKEVKNNIQDISKEYRNLNNELRKSPRHTEEYNRKLKELRRTKAILDEHKKQVNQVNQSWKMLKQVAAGVFAGNVVTSLMQRVTSAIPNLIQRNAELSDSFSDVQKTTELTDQQMAELNNKLKGFNTRTARKELLAIAAEAGKLGIRGVQNIADFVEQANELQVALGDDLGEGAVLQVSKMADVFDVSMKQMGSGINAVADNSKASAGFLTDFLARLGGTADMVNINAGEILGYGAALDELGLKVEMSSTALNGFFIDFVKNTSAYGEAAGFAQGELEKLVGSEGTNSGFLAFLQRLKETNPESDKFLRKLEEIGIDGDRGSQVFLALSQNVELLRKRQALANDEIDKGTSLTNEYNKRNNNFAANVEKINKAVAAWFTSSGIISGLQKLTGWAVKFTETKMSEELEKQRNELGRLTVALNVSNTSENERRQIIERLKELYPDHLDAIDTEKSSLEDLNIALQKVNKEMINKIIIAKESEKFNERVQKEQDLTLELQEREIQLHDQMRELMENNNYLKLDSTKTAQENAVIMLRQMKEEEDRRRVQLRIMRDDVTLRSQIVQNLERMELLEISIGQVQKDQISIAQRRSEIMKLLGMETDEQTKKVEDNNEANENAVNIVEDHRKKLSDLKQQLELNQQARENLAMLELTPEEKLRLERLKAEGREIQNQITMLEELISIEQGRMSEEQRRMMELKRQMQADIDDGLTPMAAVELNTREYKEAWRNHLDEQADLIEQDYIDGLISQKEYYDALSKLRDVYLQLDQQAWDEHVTGQVDDGRVMPEKTDLELKPMGVDVFTEWWNKNGAQVETLYSNIAATYSSFLDVMAALDQRRLNKLQMAFNAESNFLQKQLDAKVISQESYNYQMEQLEREKAKKELQIRQKAFRRDQIFNIATATMNAVMAASSALASNPYPWSIALAAAAGVMGMAQVAAIASLPAPQFAKGGMLRGPSHKRGGMPIINPVTGRKEAEVEGGEFILTKGVSSDPVLSTIASAINVAAGGKALVPSRLLNFSSNKMEQGGMVPEKENINNSGIGAMGNYEFVGFDKQANEIVAKLEEVRLAVLTPGRSFVSTDDLDRAYAQKKRADRLS